VEGMEKDKLNGVLYLLLASVSFGVMPILAKLAYAHGANSYSVLFLRFIFAAVMLLYYLLTKKISLRLNKKQFLIIALLGVVGYSATSGFIFLAYSYISVGLATMIMYTYPAIVTLLSFIIYKEKLYTRKVISLLISLAGIYTLIGVGEISLNFKGVAFAFLSAIFYSMYVLGASHSEIKKVNSYVMTFYISLTSGVTMLIFGVSTNNINFNIDYYGLVCILLLAFISTVVALMAFIQGVKIIGPSKASILSTLEPIVSLILGLLILKESISIQVLFGSIMIIASILILTTDRAKN
jgi:drug/metabolite transporter (DMT)-like permease